MFHLIRTGEKTEKLEASDLDEDSLNALSDPTRREILKELAENPSYPREVSRKMGLDKQKIYYHFNKLEEAGLLEEAGTEKVSGGSATYYRATAPAYVLDLGVQGEEVPWTLEGSDAEEFLKPLVDQGSLNGRIVVGSPDQHGPDQVQARDGHLAGEVGLKLGNYCVDRIQAVSLDTEIFRNSGFSQNLLMVGGVLTNTVTKKFNEEFPASFEGENFPYREIRTPENTYSEDSIGVVAKTENPENPEKSIFMVAGVRNQGTEAAVRAFKNLEDIVQDYGEGDFYRVVRGLDMDGDGEIDDYEVVE